LRPRTILRLQLVEGIVFDVQRFSIHDGPGIRTTVFLKGCTLRCFWCQNPEGIHPKPEIMFYPERCIGCGNCLVACAQKAHTLQNGQHIFDRQKCVACGKCAETCYAGALKIAGRLMTAEEVVKEVLRDRAFYEASGGGVTLSGGEPLLQHEFSKAILEQCKAEGIHTAIETAANCRWTDLSSILAATDLVMMDIKHLDPTKHRRFTGVTNQTILKNAEKLAETGKPLIIRVPVIPEVNDTSEEIGAIAKFIQPFPNLQYLELLPFHRLGEGKYYALGLRYAASNLSAPSMERMAALKAEAEKTGIQVQTG
jgi:pyruvate formate lyase activating enzyme